MPTPFDHLLFVALLTFGPVWGATVGYRRLVRCAACDQPRVRLSVYRAAMVMQWCLAAAVLALWAFTARPWFLLGVVPRLTWGFGGVVLGGAIVTGFIARQRRDVLSDDEALEEVRERMRHIEPMLPRTPRDLRAFAVLSITAGICEELLYRGFMIFYLSHYLPLIFAAAAAAVIFGIGHAYQGRRGIALTGMVGAFLSAVYLVAGSLYVPMLLHALMDLHSGHLGYRALQRADERDAERTLAAEESERARAAATQDVGAVVDAEGAAEAAAVAPDSADRAASNGTPDRFVTAHATKRPI
jgi:membrane protease YdiL (CAAX protease family)